MKLALKDILFREDIAKAGQKVEILGRALGDISTEELAVATAQVTIAQAATTAPIPAPVTIPEILLEDEED